MATSLLTLVNNLVERIYEIECKYKRDNKKRVRLNTKIAVLFCKRNYQKESLMKP